MAVEPTVGGQRRWYRAASASAGRGLQRLFLPGESAAENALFLALVLVGAAVRLLWLGEIPQGLNYDEASEGYDAWALLHHGIDRHGYRYPVHQVAWGSGQAPLYGYLAWPFIKLLGLNLLSFRLPQAILGVAALFVMYAVGRRLAGRGFALCALFVLAISPWHVMLSRWGLDCNLLPTMVLFAFALLLRGLQRPRWMVAAFLLLGLALYAYIAAYVFVPLFTLALLAYGTRRRLADLRHWGLGLALMAVVGLPIGTLVVINHFDLPAIETPLFSIPRFPAVPRYELAAFFADDPLRDMARNTWWAFRILVLDGHGHLEHHALPRFGYFYKWVGLCVTLAGVGFLLHDWARGRRPENLLVLIWLAAGLVIATLVHPNVNRMNVVFFPLLLCAAYGLYGAFPRIRVWRRDSRGRSGTLGRKATNVLCVAAVAWLALSFAAFTRYYFCNWGEGGGFCGQTLRFHSHPSFAEALALVVRSTDAHDPIVIGRGVSYAIPLFLDPPHPHLYLQTVDIENRPGFFQRVRSFGRYRFGMDAQAAANGTAFVINNDKLPQFHFPASDFVVTRFDRWSAVLRRK